MCSAIGGAISAAVEPMPDGLSRQRRDRTDAAQRCEAGLRPQSFGIAAGPKEKLCSSNMADRIAGDEAWRQLVDEGDDHRIQVRDLVMQFEVTASGFEADAVGLFQVAICGQIWSPRGQSADELHAGQAAQSS
jgi:hypothetical protein